MINIALNEARKRLYAERSKELQTITHTINYQEIFHEVSVEGHMAASIRKPILHHT